MARELKQKLTLRADGVELANLKLEGRRLGGGGGSRTRNVEKGAPWERATASGR